MLRTHFILVFLFLLAACSMQDGQQLSPFEDYRPGADYGAIDGQTIGVDGMGEHSSLTLDQPLQRPMTSGKVAILLPLSGQNAEIGQAMLNAAQMALFDVNDGGFELLPFDTEGTRSGTSRAVDNAAAQSARLILGPLVADNVQTAGITARQYDLQVIGFTTDSTKIGGNVMTLGILPNDQGKRMAQYAARNALNRIAVITTNDSYARAVISAFEDEIRQNNVSVVEKQALRSAADAARIAQLLASKADQFDAIFMPIGNPHLANMARSLAENQLGTNVKPWLGAGLWDDSTIQSNPLMRNAVYAAPSPQQREAFERQYRAIYGGNPHRLASLAYDATALSIVLLRQNSGIISRTSLMNANGFSGIDGIFRFQPNGLAERGLAIHQIAGTNRTNVIDPAPDSFMIGAR